MKNISIFPVIRCGYPGHILNGHVIGRSYLFGDVIHYSCRQGYKLDGPKSRQCTKSGHWSGKRPICRGSIDFFTYSFSRKKCAKALQIYKIEALPKTCPFGTTF